MSATPYVVGVVAALAVAAFARGDGFDRDRAFWPTVLVVVASYYVLFAVMGGSMRALALEGAGMLAFTVVAVAGFRRDLRIVAAALAGHGVFDLVHAPLIANPGVPAWWPAWCMSFDVAAGVVLAWLLARRPLAPTDGRASLSPAADPPSAAAPPSLPRRPAG